MIACNRTKTVYDLAMVFPALCYSQRLIPMAHRAPWLFYYFHVVTLSSVIEFHDILKKFKTTTFDFLFSEFRIIQRSLNSRPDTRNSSQQLFKFLCGKKDLLIFQKFRQKDITTDYTFQRRDSLRAPT